MEYDFYVFYSDFSLHDSLENKVSEYLEQLKFQNFQRGVESPTNLLPVLCTAYDSTKIRSP